MANPATVFAMGSLSRKSIVLVDEHNQLDFGRRDEVTEVWLGTFGRARIARPMGRERHGKARKACNGLLRSWLRETLAFETPRPADPRQSQCGSTRERSILAADEADVIDNPRAIFGGGGRRVKQKKRAGRFCVYKAAKPSPPA